MTGNEFLLDTNIIVEVFKGNRKIADKINKLSSGFYISSIVLGELYIGLNRVTNRAKHLKKLNSFLALCTVLPADSTTAEHYGAVIAELYKKGKPVPTNDAWIAAVALQHNLIVVTQDKHFAEIAKLKTQAW